ncbi:MAG: hypothetical protein WBL40_01385, partial [Terrimicrobiaceae bacterium]
MNHQLLVVLSLLGVCVALFIANRPRMDVVALIALVAIFIPVVLLLAERQKLSPRRLMMSVKFRRVDQRHAHAGRHGAESRGRRRAATRRICGFRFFHFHAIRHGHPRGGLGRRIQVAAITQSLDRVRFYSTCGLIVPTG